MKKIFRFKVNLELLFDVAAKNEVEAWRKARTCIETGNSDFRNPKTGNDVRIYAKIL